MKILEAQRACIINTHHNLLLTGVRDVVVRAQCDVLYTTNVGL